MKKKRMHWERIHIHLLNLIFLLRLSLCPTFSPFLFICTIRLSAVFPINFLLFCSYSDSRERVKVQSQAAEALIHIIHTGENEIYFCKYSSILHFEENIGFSRIVTRKCCFSFLFLPKPKTQRGLWCDSLNRKLCLPSHTHKYGLSFLKRAWN